jgi:leucyl aminopeptidase
VLFDDAGALAAVVLGVKAKPDMWALAAVYSKLPQGVYHIESAPQGAGLAQLALGWSLCDYYYSQAQIQNPPTVKTLVVSSDVLAKVQPFTDATCLVRDLINDPAENMGPAELAGAAQHLADQCGATFHSVTGTELEKEFPAMYAVGKASHRDGHMIELNWGDDTHPKLSLVGKGVCFDTGGLDIKSDAGMRYMQKDMGGAAHVLGLAQLIMQAKLPVRLQVVIGAVDNAIGPNAYRPGDIVKTRLGKTIEVGHTDAEGRVVLADALAYASESKPQMIIDFATLTGARMVALGTDVAAVFSKDEATGDKIKLAGQKTQDAIWPMPLYQPYNELIDSTIADISNNSKSPYGGAITAGLFLERFVGDVPEWVHVDLTAWNVSAKPGRPKGGEAMGLRAVFEYLKGRFA